MREEAPHTSPRTRRGVPRFAWRLAGLGATALLLALLLRAIVGVSAADIERTVDGAGLLAPVVYALVLTLGLTVPFNPVSDLLTVSAAALLFDPPTAIAATFVAHSLAVTLNYLVGRRFGRAALRLLAGERAAALVDRLGEHLSYRNVFLVRFVLPLTGIGIDVVSYLAGMHRLGFARFFAASIVPWTLLSVLFFTSTAFFRERAPLFIFLPAAVLVLAPTVIVALRKRQGVT